MLNKIFYKHYVFLEEINDFIEKNLLKFKNINIIVDINGIDKKSLNNQNLIIRFAKKNKIPFFFKNNYQKCAKFKADGIFIDSANKNNIKPILLKKTFKIIGSAHNQSEYSKKLQQNWHMPAEYQELDIASYVLGLCQQENELQRVAQELLLYQERNLFNLLKYLKYLVDTLRKNNIVWGVGRGSSVASYVLFLIGVHKIDSLYYNLDIEEFLK